MELDVGDSVTVEGYEGVAFYIKAITEDEDSGEVYYTVVMVGDDYRHYVDPSECTPLDREEYCGQCGQMGCTHDGLDRE